MVKSIDWKKAIGSGFLWKTVPIGLIFAVRVWGQWQDKMFSKLWFGDILLILGWIIGWMVAEADHLFYAAMCNPQELTCQRVRSEIGKRDLKKAWVMLEETKGERSKLPVRNLLTVFVMLGVGLWAVSSSGSPIAAGMVLGFSIKLYSEFLRDRNWDKWYWVFARKFSPAEHRVVKTVWGILLAVMWWWMVKN